MTRPDKDREIAAVASQLDGLLDQLAAAVASLNAILTRPAEEPHDERAGP